MGKVACVFPGQGAQTVGMGKDLYEHLPESREMFAKINDTLGFDLTSIMFEGPEDKLRLTYHTQPALLAVSAILFRALADKGLKPDYVAGHSLGEYSALVAADALSFEDGLKTVFERGRLMDRAVPAGQGAMAAVLGAEREALQELCARISEETGLVELANVNCPGQIVVSGSAAGVQAVVENGKAAGAKRVIPLEVSGPFHSSLMQPAADGLREVLTSVNVQAPSVPLIANVTAQPVQAAEEIRQLLVKQVVAPVLWEDSVRVLLDKGVDTFIEVGTGTVLAGLIKKIDRQANIVSVHSYEALQACLEEGAYA
ncbi:[acyl-carrier-protein] S-malonyltransferase [Xylanibacillus composti]|uniref:Malonyl CoA-acyl carrier protein transacylase n=1 Tax=Xylanibacillus composti TaxID=1572762 RepID=A0A8J4H3A4_9BACL|nr:ACP S-malonyltransferase [Xylanibacillus composti]MDT9724132.1 [acyl-carrier-protein] S-malonyltransferase [Xylanibacillus composti]GIQ68682.1 malonyl CoA-acyl carrier protein transacylase [Xylanibacillus composti]